VSKVAGWIVGFGKFWYDFIIGDDWRLAAGVVAAVVALVLSEHRGANWWWLLPVCVAALLTISVTHELRSRKRPS
jgi:hypothetical protein